MAIYQAPRKRWRIALAAGLAGLIAGFAIGAIVSGGEPGPVAVIRTLDEQLDKAASPLDVLVIHRDVGTTSANDPTVAHDAVRRVARRFDEVRPAVHALDPVAEREVDRRIATLQRLISHRAGAGEIAAEAGKLAELLRGIIGGRAP